MSLTEQESTILNQNDNQIIIEANPLIFDNVLAEHEVNSILYLVEKWQSRFLTTETGDDNSRSLDKQKRDSLVLFDFEPIYSFFRLQLLKYAEPVKQRFNYEMDWNKGYECQLTAHNDGHFYTAHTDYAANTGTRVSLRNLTFVYYFYQEPKSFEGGELFLWNHYAKDCSPLERANEGVYIEPLRNRVIFFESKYWHEVLKINCPSQEFMNSRFTLNGWLH